MGTEISKGILEQTSRVQKAFAEAIKDVESPESVEQKSEPTFDKEHLSLKIEQVKNVLDAYTPIFKETVLRAVIADLAGEIEAYKLEVEKQTAVDNLLDVLDFWSIGGIEQIKVILRKQVL